MVTCGATEYKADPLIPKKLRGTLRIYIINHNMALSAEQVLYTVFKNKEEYNLRRFSFK